MPVLTRARKEGSDEAMARTMRGVFPVSVDSQSRITVPAAFREGFKESQNEVCLIHMRGALWGFTPEAFDEWADRYFGQEIDESDDDYQDRLLYLNSRATSVELDKAGRLPVGKCDPDDLEQLNLGKEAVVVGNKDHIEIYNAEAWAQKKAELAAAYEAKMFKKRA